MEVKMMEQCCCHKTKHRSEEEYKTLINRLSRIEGQVRGVRKMVENDAYCVDILTQVSAIQAALNGFNRELLSNHIRTCVMDDIRNGNDEIVDELVQTLQKLMK
jgi:DNA-binding FrmR family transcriptional regulator